jgi:hypothetical protein
MGHMDKELFTPKYYQEELYNAIKNDTELIAECEQALEDIKKGEFLLN